MASRAQHGCSRLDRRQRCASVLVLRPARGLPPRCVGERRQLTPAYPAAVEHPARLLDLGTTPYLEAWDLQRSIAAAVAEGTSPDTILLLEHPPVITLGRRAEHGELHVPPGTDVEIVETDRGGKSTYHGPGQLVC